MAININQLKKLIPLNKIDDETLSRLAYKAKYMTLEEGETIYSRGSEDDHIYYLLDGAICMTDDEEKTVYLHADNEQARFAFGSLKPRPSNAVVDSNHALLVRFDAKQLDTAITWNEMVRWQQHDDMRLTDVNGLGIEGVEVVDIIEDSTIDSEWMMTLLNSESFHRLPPENVQLLVEKMESFPASTGEIIIKQGDVGDYYYVVREGRCQVIHNGVMVDEVVPTEGFGEEALVSGNPRNATVQMIEDGVLMRLSKSDFDKLLVPQLVRRIDTMQAIEMAREGAILIDVRTREEFKHNRLARSINIPLGVLRLKLKRLSNNRDKTYIVYCDTGMRSSVASFLLKQAGYNVYLLEDPQEAFRLMSPK